LIGKKLNSLGTISLIGINSLIVKISLHCSAGRVFLYYAPYISWFIKIDPSLKMLNLCLNL